MTDTKIKDVLMVVRWPVGGIRTYLKYVFKDWSGSAIRVTFLMPSSHEVESLRDDEFSIPIVWRLHRESNPSFIEWFKFVGTAIRSKKWDLIHCQGFTSAISASLWLRGGCASLFTSHDVLLRDQFKGIKGALKRQVIGRLLVRFNVVQAVSNDGMENMLEYFPAISRTQRKVILNGVDTDKFFNAVPKNLRKELNVGDDIKLIGFFGRFMAQKGFKFLVEALVGLEKGGHKFLCLCYGAGAFIREEQAMLRDRGIEHLFLFQGFEPDISSCIKAVDLVVMPSLWEACPLQPMEVLSAGVPFVGTRCIGLREVCKDTPAVLCNPARADDLSVAIEAAISLPVERFSDYAVEARDRYGKKKMQDQYVELYRQLIAGEPIGHASQ